MSREGAGWQESTNQRNQNDSGGRRGIADDVPWGDPLQRRDEGAELIGFLNRNGIRMERCEGGRCDCGDCKIRGFMKENDFSIFGHEETNVNWSAIPAENRLHERTRTWFQRQKQVSANNVHGVRDRHQYGGVSQWSVNSATCRANDSGQDARKLGRWVHTRYRGRNGVNLRVVTAYRPCRNTGSVGSVWSQQKTYFDEQEPPIVGCPRDIFDAELCEQLQAWSDAGEQIVLGLDVNENVRSERENSFTRKMEDCGLLELITTPVSYTHLTLPTICSV